MKGRPLSHYAVRALAIGAFALAVVMLVPPFAQHAALGPCAAGVLLAGVLDAAVYAFLRHVVTARPSRFDAAWLVAIGAKFFVLGAGCLLARVLAPDGAWGFMYGAAIAFALFVANGAVSLWPHLDRQDPRAFVRGGTAR